MTDSPSSSDLARIRAARTEAYSLGYLLYVDEALGVAAPVTHEARCAPYIERQASVGRFLAYSTSKADAAEAGLEVLRGVVKRGDPWPDA